MLHPRFKPQEALVCAMVLMAAADRQMSDAELADIGLTRADLHVAIDVPFGADPTVKLRAIASDRADTIEDLARKVA